MGRRKAHIPLNVLLNNRLVGQLEKEPSGATQFVYDTAWLGWENALPVSLSLPLRETRFTGAPVTAVFENLLPDSIPIRNRVAERVGAEGTDSYSLLAKIGRDCVGALQFLPGNETADTSGAIQRAYGVPAAKPELPMAARVTFLVGPDGKIARVWPKVDPVVNAGEVLDAVKALDHKG